MVAAAVTLKRNIVNGIPVPTFLTQKDVDRLKHIQLYEDDVWIASYPKSGSTWLQQIVKLIKNRGEPTNEMVSLSVPWLEATPHLHPELKIDDIARPRTFKTHFPYHLLPCGPPNTTPCKYIYIIRNPKDVAVSIYYHFKFDTSTYPDLDFNTYWELFMGEDILTGNYFAHLKSWLPHKDDENVLFLTYEGMKKDPVSSISKIVSFMGIELSSDIVTKIAELTSFDTMKRDRSANKWWRYGENEDGVSNFMRKGTVGDWKTHLSEEQSAQIDEICAQIHKDTGFEFVF